MFDGFSPAALEFLDDLGRNNTREWFRAHRATYDKELLEPAKAFVLDMGEALYRINPAIKADPRVNGSIRRIARDTRFSKDKRPYKDHLDFFFLYEGASREGPGFFIRITSTSVIIGAGTHLFERSHLAAFRAAVDADETGKPLAALLRRLEKKGYTPGGEQYKRVPRGFARDHRRADLLRFGGLYVHKETVKPKVIHSASFLTFCARHFSELLPLTEWISGHVAVANP